MSDQNLLYWAGITLVKGIGNITARQIIETLGDISLLFTEKKYKLERISGLSRRMIEDIHNPEVLKIAEKEICYLEKINARLLHFTSPDFPHRLKDCVDAPPVLYFKGNTDFNTSKAIGVVGTRNATTYGKELVAQLLNDVKEKFPDSLIVSGLAYGIDIAAHKESLNKQLATVGVLAHGLDRIYPYVHRKIAEEMQENGGLLTEFMSETNPDKPNFVKRNRIVAGISDCTIVVESAAKGGALITANIADSYHRDVFSFPGKTTDKYSAGCNQLIKSKKAALITSAEDLFQEMNWIDSSSKKHEPVQQLIFPDLSVEEQAVMDILSEKENMQLNQLSLRLNLPVGQLSVILFELEMNGLVRCKPGGMYAVNY